MDYINILTIAGIPSAITGIVAYMLKKYLDKREKEREKREHTREEFEYLLVKCVGASLCLGEATAKAIKTGNTNGEMSGALDYVHEVKHEQKEFLQKQGLKNLF